MKQVIYIDVLIALNIIITFLLLLASSKIMKTSPSAGRLLLGSVLGGASSLIILAPDVGFILSLVTKLLFSVIIVVSVYNSRNIKTILTQAGVFFAVSFLFAGIMLFASSLPGISIIRYNNGAVYINLSFFSLTAACVLCYAVTCILAKVTKRKAVGEDSFSIKIISGEKTVTGRAFLDTGNALSDPFSGEAVIIAEKNFIKDVLPPDVSLWLDGGSDKCEKVRLVPFSSVGNSGLMPAFKADKIIISDTKNEYIIKNAEIAVSSGSIPDALLPPEILTNTERSNKHDKIYK